MFKLEIETGNDAFADGNLFQEIGRILMHVAQKAHDGSVPAFLFDLNGAKVGFVEFTDEDEG